MKCQHLLVVLIFVCFSQLWREASSLTALAGIGGIGSRVGSSTARQGAIVEVSHDEAAVLVDREYETRFANVARLYPNPLASLDRLRRAHVCVIGLGGVGSWVVEALARSGVGKLTLVDCDDICVSNVNRQIHALSSTVGKFKAQALCDRVLDINPHAEVHVCVDFVRPENAVAMLTTTTTTNDNDNKNNDDDTMTSTSGEKVAGGGLKRFDYVCECADGVSDKAAIIDVCVKSKTPIVVSGGVGGLTDPSKIVISDMAQAAGDQLVMHVRKKLRQKYGYPKGIQMSKKGGGLLHKGAWGVSVVHTLPTGEKRTVSPKKISSSGEVQVDVEVEEDEEQSESTTTCAPSDGGGGGGGGGGGFRACDVSFGNACFSTGIVGLYISSIVVNQLALGEAQEPIL